MKLHVFDIPDEADQLPAWLERQLVGPDLAAVISELAAVHGADHPQVSLDGVLQGEWPRLLKEGLRALSPGALTQLLVRPTLLLELQERVFLEGGAYWDQLPHNAPELTSLAERGQERLNELVPLGVSASASAPGPANTSRQSTWYVRPWFVASATAAAVLVAVICVEQFRQSQSQVSTAWGWNAPGALSNDVPANAYLLRLAEGAGAWNKARPEDAAGVARRISEFRQGCTRLILADHKPLPPADRDWLVSKCQAWAGKLDGHLRDLEAGQDPLVVRAAADETISKLQGALKTRAGELSVAT